MNIVILSRNENLYSTKRLLEEGEARNHHIEAIDPLMCDLVIEKEKPKVYYNDRCLDYIDAIIHFCDQNSIDLESVPKLIPKPLKEKIKYEAQELNFLKRTSRAKLPIF